MGFYFLRYYARRVTFFIVWSTSKLPIVVIFFLLGWFLGMDHWYAFRFTNISLFIDKLLRGLKHQLQGTHPPIFIVVFFIRFSCYFTFFAFVDDTATFSTFVNVVAVDLSRSLRLYQASMLFLQFKRVIEALAERADWIIFLFLMTRVLAIGKVWRRMDRSQSVRDSMLALFETGRIDCFANIWTVNHMLLLLIFIYSYI